MIICTNEITRDLQKHLGEIRAILLLDGNKESQRYLVNNKWHVIITSSEDCTLYYIEEYQSPASSHKYYGHKLHRLMKATNVPWEIARLVGELDEKTALRILEAINYARENLADSDLRHELIRSYERRTTALSTVLGAEIWNLLSSECISPKRTKTLGKYIANSK